MTFIVLDMEWSQAVCREKIAVKGTRTLPVEIIQIGAVIVKDGKIIPEHFSENIKPVYYKVIKRRIRNLTGIDEDALKDADCFQNVIGRFRSWCERYGGNIIATWGGDDVYNLKSQCEFFGLDSSWIPQWFNLQPLVTRQLNIDRPQISLGLAVELMGIDSSMQYHSAINDAVYTAMILMEVRNIEQGIKWQRKADYARRNPYRSLCVTTYGKRKYTRVISAIRSPEIRRYVCPLCGRPSTLKDKLVNIKPHVYMAVIKCPKHTMQITVTFVKQQDGKYSWIKEITMGDKQTEQSYYSRLERKNRREIQDADCR